MKSALKNAATAQESFATDNDGSYATTVTELTDEGFRFAVTDVDFDDAGITATGSTGYCMEATSAHKATIAWYLDSRRGCPRRG